jgi:hypothetical protein
MGKNHTTVSDDKVTGCPATIARNTLIAAVNRACAAVHNQHGEEADSLIHSVKALARVTPKIDANTWKCVNSCGCPMVAAGYVLFESQLRPEQRDDPQYWSPPETFAGEFDLAIGELTDIHNAVTFEVVG